MNFPSKKAAGTLFAASHFIMKILLTTALLATSALTCFASTPTSRVHFRPGATSTVLRGYSTPARPNHIYIVQARRGQTLNMSISSSTRGFVPMLFITAPSGRNLIEDKRYQFKTRLQESGYYRIRVAVNQMATNARSGNYRLPLSIR